MSVGPVSVAAIMVASALAAPEMKNNGDQIGNAAILALEGGLLLTAFSVLRLGSLVNLLSHPVLSGFSSGAAILIILSQLPHLVGAPPTSHNAGLAALHDLPNYLMQINGVTVAIGFCSVITLASVQPSARPVAVSPWRQDGNRDRPSAGWVRSLWSSQLPWPSSN